MQKRSSMKRIVSIILIISIFFLYGLAPVAAEISQLKKKEANREILQNKLDNKAEKNKSQKETKEKSTNRFIVKYKKSKEETGKEKIQNLMKKDIKNIKNLKRKNKKNQSFDLIETNNKMDYGVLLENLQLEADDIDIEYIQPDYKISLSTNDTYYSEQWALGEDSNVAETEDTVNANIISAWERAQGEGVLIAVIDTGIDTNHEDLWENIWVNENEIPDNGMDDDGNGYIDDVVGWNFSDDTNILYNRNSINEVHGTHIAGVIAAQKGNGKGIAGTAPKAEIMALKAFNEGTAYTSDIIEAIEYAKNMGAQIVNCSWGGPYENPILKEIIEESNMLFVCAAGNNGDDIGIYPLYPAAYREGNIISVASINRNGNLSSFSNYGELLVDVASPGEDIISTLPDNEYGKLSGTSMAAAFVSGKAALVLSAYEGIEPREVKEKIIETSDMLPSLIGKVLDGNVINCGKAVPSLNLDNSLEQEEVDEEEIVDENPISEEATVENTDSAADSGENLPSDDGTDENAVTADEEIVDGSTEPVENSSEGIPADDSTDENTTTDEVAEPDTVPTDNLTDQPISQEPVSSEEPAQNKTILDSNELFQDKIIGKIIKKVDYYSDADDKEKKIILDYFQIEEDLFIECDERGYSLIDSIFAASIAKDYDFSLDEVERMLELYVNIKEVYRQINKFELFKEKERLTDDTVKRTKDLMLKGHLLYNIEFAYNQSKLLGEDIESIIDNKENIETFNTLNTVIDEEPIYHNAPFDFRKNGKEYIRASNGSLTYEEVDLSLPGRNGLDLNLVTRFQSADAGSFNYFGNSIDKETGDDPLGIGWTFGFTKFYTHYGFRALRLATGEIYTIKITSDYGATPETYELEDYDLKDIKFKEDSGNFTNGVKSSEYVLEYKDGKKEYFADDGRLLGIVDPFGNTIKFEHKYSGTFPVITKIIDTLGRTVEISYLNDYGPYKSKTIVTAPDGSTIEYLLRQIGDDHTYGDNKIYELEAKIDQEGRRTEFSNTVQEAKIFISREGTSPNDLLIIDKITYPTGAKSHYKYEMKRAEISKSTSSYIEYFRITSRYDSIYLTRYNEEDYSYVGDYTAYGVSGHDELQNYTYSTTITDSKNTQRTITFKKRDPDGRKIKEEIKENGINLLREINYEYNSDNLPIREETISYDPSQGSSMTKIIEMDYDSRHYGDLIEYTDELGHKTTYTYDSNFHRLESETRYLDLNTYEKTEYEIDSLNGSIKNIKRNYLDDGTWKRIITDYTYDSYGNRIREKTRMEDGSFVIKNYEYDPVYQYGYLTKIYTNVEGYDLNNLSKTSQTIEERFDYYFDTGNQLAYVDGNSKITAYGYDKLGRITKIIYPDTDEKTIDYDDTLNIVTVTNEEGYQTKHIYDRLGRLLKKQEIKDGVWITPVENSYNSLGQIEWIKDGEGNKTSYEYDALGRQIKIINPDSTEIKITYNDDENSKIVENEEGDPYKYYYDKTGNLIGEIVWPDKDGLTFYITYYTYDYVGNLTSKTDANGHKTKYVYDNLSRLISVEDPYHKITKYQYSYLGDLKKITTGVSDPQGAGYQVNSSKSNSIQESTFVDMMTTQSTETRGHIAFVYADISCYSNNKFVGAISSEYNIPLGEERSESIEVIKYDTDGNEFEVVSARIYDSDELLDFNPIPFKIHTFTEEEKASGTVSYTQSITEEHSSIMVIFCYEKKDITKGSTVIREYDELGRVIKETDPLNKTVYMAYDGTGNIIGKRDRNEKITTFSYDDRNRLLNKNAGFETISYTYEGTGNVRSMEDSIGITSYTYYENGRLKRQTEPDGKYIEYDYDKSGNKISTTDYFGKGITYGYDNRNRLETVTVDGLTTTYGYYSDGARHYVAYPGGTIEAYGYDGINNLTALQSLDSSFNTINEFKYTYDGVGNQLTKVDKNGTTSYTYDKLNRLETVSEPDGNITTYTYDDNGNIATKNMEHGPNYTYTFKEGGVIKEMKEIINHTITFENDDNNRLTRVTEIVDNTGAVSSPYVGNIAITTDMTYDDNGNLLETTKGGSADEEISGYKYNELNQMTEYTNPNLITTTYGYSGSGLRKTKTSGNTTTEFYYEGQNVINETENAAFKARNIRGINIIAREDNVGTRAYYLYNGHGDTVNLVTDSGTIVNTYDYDVYGKEKIAQEGTLKNPYRYAGEYYDEESELYYLRARYYDPNIARFISEDSYKGDPSYPLSLNLYTYSYNNPIKYIDPSGHNPLIVKGAELLQVIFQEAQMLIYQYGPEISYGIQQGGKILTDFGSEMLEGAKKAKDGVVNALNNDRGSIDLSKFGKGTSNLRKLPGVASGLDKLSDSAKLLRGSNGNAGFIPHSIGEQLSGKNFNSFDEFRGEFWKTVANSEYASEFGANNIARMKDGLAPIAHSTQQYKGLKSYVLHHSTPIHAGGDVYDMSNITVVSPRMHQEILDKEYHFGN